MNHRKTRIALMFGSVMLSVASAPALAQSQAAGGETSSEGAEAVASEGEILVTAQRRTQSINDVGMAITALSGEALVNQGIESVADLTRLVPGFTYAESQKGAPIYTIRGVGLYEESLAASPAVTLYLDEVGYPFPILADLATLDVERVEVLKGPQGTLYGQNSTGGAINYVSNKPGSVLSGNFDASVNSFGGLSTSAAVGGPISNTLQGRIALGYDVGGAWQESFTREDKNGSKDLLRGRALLDWTPSEDLTVSLNLSGFRDRSDTIAVALYRVTPQVPAAVTPEVLAQPLAPEKPNTADWTSNPPLESNRDYYAASLKLVYDISGSTSLISTTSYQNYEQDNYRDTDGSALDVFSVRQTGTIESLFQELRLTGTFGGGAANWTLGASYANDETNENNTAFVVRASSARGFLRFGIPPFAAALASDQQKIQTKAVFGNIEYELTDKFSVLGGLRYTDYRNKFVGCTKDVDGNLAAALTLVQTIIKSRMTNPTPVVTIPQGSCITLDSITADPGLHRAELKQDNISWRAGVNFKPDRGSLVYLSASRGYKSGSFPNLSASGALALRPVSQETVLAYEGGIKTELGRIARVEASAFYYDYQDKQLRGRILDPGGVQGALEALVNVPKSRAWGIEASIFADPMEGLTLRASGLYLDTKVTDDFLNYDPFGVAVNFKGNEYPFSPKWSLSAGAEYETPISASANLFVGADISYQSKSTSAFGGSPLVTIDGYELVDVRAGVELSDMRLRATLWVKNLFDKYYWTDTFRQVDNLSRHVGMGRSAGLRLSYDF